MSEHEVDLTTEERDILLDPCACGHTLNDHGDLGGCWICNETNDRECWVRCEDMFAERAARIVAVRLADAEARAEAAEAKVVRVRSLLPHIEVAAHPVGLHIAEDIREALRGDQ